MGKFIGGAEYLHDETKLEDLNTEFVGVYFSAHWCPPCRSFTPKLSEFYTKTKEILGPQKFEVIFVSSDNTLEEFNEYFGVMPWRSLKFDQ